MKHDNITLEHGSITLGVRDYGGEGAPLVLLHGGTRNVSDWDESAALLRAHHRVVALDVRSHGYSTPCGATWRFEDAVADVEAVIDHLGLDNPFVAGHSIGGMIAVLYGAKHPACRGVIDIDGVGISLPARFPEPHGVAARQRVRTMIEMMIEAAAVPAPSEPILLTADKVEARIMAARVAAQRHEQDEARASAFTARAFFQHPDGSYEENPSAVAQSAFSHALIGYDLFALIRTVRCPLLYIAAMDASPPTAHDDFAYTMYLWRDAIQADFAAISQPQPNVLYKSIVGDHMLIPNAAAAVVDLLLAFTHAPPAPL